MRADRHAALPLALATVLAAAALPGQNCANTSIGQLPLTELTGSYGGFAGGLWPGGGNAPAAGHRSAGLQHSLAIAPLDAAGQPSAGGRIVLLSIGMSNTTQEFSTFLPLSNADPNRNGAVTLVDGAQGGQHAGIIVDPTANFWTVVDQRLAAAGVTPQQVQAVWLKEAVAGPTGGFPSHAQLLRDYLGQIARNLKSRYANVRLCFLSSRIYAGYATSTLNPEPYAYESAFSVRWVIEQQQNGDPQLNHDASLGPVLAPWLGWGPYLWADGTTPRADGLQWLCADYQADGTHPSTTGRDKVAALLDAFFTSSEFTVPWYVGAGRANAAFSTYGAGCPGTAGVPEIVTNSLPTLGNGNFRIGVRSAAPGRLALLLLSFGQAALPFAGSCLLRVDPQLALPSVLMTTSGQGTAITGLPVPNAPWLAGLQVFAQWGVDDPLGAPLPPLLGIAGTAGGSITVGF